MTFVPQNTKKIFATLNLYPGQTPEPPISSEVFLRSYLECGVWIRALAMASHVQTLASTGSSRLQKLAASAGVYQQNGLAIEDSLATLICWSLWADDKKANLPDIMSRVVLRSDARSTEYGPGTIEEIKEKNRDGRRIFLDGRRYLRALVHGVPTNRVPGLFGIEWKRNPSVKVIAKRHLNAWNTLPSYIVDNVSVLTDISSEITTACFNKLKHGPQLVVDKPKDAAKRMRHANAEIESMPDGQLLRVLIVGSRTSVTTDELHESKRIAPFILDDADNARRLLNQGLMGNALFMYLLGRFLYGTTFIGHDIPEYPSDTGLYQLLDGWNAALQ